MDDFGLRDFTGAPSEDLYELVCQRVRQEPGIVVSNRLPGDWYGLFPNPVLGERLLDRLVNTAYRVAVGGGAGDATALGAAPGSHPWRRRRPRPAEGPAE